MTIPPTLLVGFPPAVGLALAVARPLAAWRGTLVRAALGGALAGVVSGSLLGLGAVRTPLGRVAVVESLAGAILAVLAAGIGLAVRRWFGIRRQLRPPMRE